jgi:hypothetical protein
MTYRRGDSPDIRRSDLEGRQFKLPNFPEQVYNCHYAGWIGFDPSLGLAISERHIVLAASYDPTLTLPTSGSFWAKEVKPVLKTTITIELSA